MTSRTRKIAGTLLLGSTLSRIGATREAVLGGEGARGPRATTQLPSVRQIAGRSSTNATTTSICFGLGPPGLAAIGRA